MALPAGTVSFLFTDIEGSTRLLEALGDRYDEALAVHRAILAEAIENHGGTVFGTEGDAVFAAFTGAGEAVGAAREAQRALTAHPWPAGAEVRVRMAVHTGDARLVGGDYVGLSLHVAARVCAAGHGRQLLVTAVTRQLAGDDGLEVRDLGEHRLKDLHEPVRILQVVGEGLDEDFPPLRTLTAMPNNLPAPTDAFIGRDADLTQVIDGLSGHRLVTLTGAGGTGKSRLAMEAAGALLPSLRDGAWLVELASSSDGSRVPALVASVLGLGERAGQPLIETLADWLKPRDLLLVIDNCEHLIDGVAELAATLLRSCPGVRILATSRELLGVRGELALRLAPLAVDGAALDLFVERARAAVGRFDPSGDDLALVGQLCRRLDGLPLAIELAAARLRILSLAQLVARLDDRFRLLTGGSRTDLARQRTLEAVVGWSYELLGDAERSLFRAVSVFPDSFSLDAAAAVSNGDEADVVDVVDGLGRLVEKSLLVPLEGRTGTERYQLLETLRQYGRDRLVDHGEAEERRDLLLAWAMTHVQELERVMRTPAQDRVLATAALERANLRAAMEWAADRGDTVAALRLASAVPIGLNSERRTLIEDLLAQAGDGVPIPVRGQARLTLANLAFEQSDWAATVAAAAAARAAFEEVGDRVHGAWATYFVITGSWGAGDFATVDQLLSDVLAEFRDLDVDFGIAYTLWTASQRDSDPTAAAALAEEAERRFRALGSPMGLAHTVEGRGLIALDAGDLEGAVPFLGEAVELFSNAGNLGCTAHALEAVAVWASATGDAEAAAELVGAAETLRAASGQGHRPWEVRARLGVDFADEGDFDAGAAARGRGHSVSSAAALATALLQQHAKLP